MKIDMSCPVELWQFSKPTEEEPECTFVLNNLSEKTVVSVQTTLVCYGQEEELLFRQIERIQGLRAGAGERFSIMILPTQWEGVQGVDLVIEKVWFDDATVWRRGNAALVEYQPNALLPGRKLDQLRFVAGQDAVGYPVEQEHVWVCVCGRANVKSQDRCCRCGRRAEAVFASYQKTNVDQIIVVHEQKLLDMAKKAREEAGMRAEEREKELQRKKSRARNTARVAGIIASVGALALALVVWGIPTFQHQRAEGLLNDGKFDEARAAFAQMQGHQGAEEQFVRCDYLEAKSWMETGDKESLVKAAEAFARIGDFEDCQELRKQAIYQMGEMALEAGEWEQSEAYFRSLGSYQDSADKVSEGRYLQAYGLMREEAYADAGALFEGLGAYKDARERAASCQYAIGLAEEDAKEYQAAIDVFMALGSYQDAPERLQSARYQLAEQRMAADDYEAAGQLYLQAGEYLDAQIKANDSLYQLAQERYREADYGKARELFAQIIPYLDSESRSWDCVYRQAEQASALNQYQTALEGFASIPQYRDAADRVTECRYLLATESIAKGALDEAEALLAELTGYQDSEKLLKQTRYQIGQKAASEGKYQRAVDMFEALGSYSDSPARLRDSRYQLARNALFDEKFEVAIEGFSALGNYEDAAQQLKEAVYGYAMERKNAGDIEAAMELLSSIKDHEESRRELLQLTLDEAQRKRNEGDAESANALLLAMEDEPEAIDLYHAWQYGLAMDRKIAGLYSEAGGMFFALGDYQDAAAQGEECYQLYYGVVAEPARVAMEAKDYRTVVETLEGFPMTELPKAYQDLPGLYEQACYAYAEKLYAEGKPYEALPYYERIPDYKDVQQRLSRRCYLILGRWRSAAGEEAEFRPDGTCVILGEASLFAVENYTFFTGQEAGSLEPTHRLSNVTQTGLTLRDTRNGQSTTYKFERVKEEEAPAGRLSPTVTSAPSGLEDMLVQEDDDATFIP